jgi:hypothetical protein
MRTVRWLMMFPAALAGSVISFFAMYLVHRVAEGYVPAALYRHRRWEVFPVLEYWAEVPIASAAFAGAAALFVFLGTLTAPKDARERAPAVLFLFGAALAPFVLPGTDSKRGIAYAIACYASGLLTAFLLTASYRRRRRMCSRSPWTTSRM